MGYLPGFQHDIFISYAHVDNAAVDQADGWVTQFREHLDLQMSKRVGRMGAVKIWQDPALEGGQLFDKTIEDAINGSAIFIALTSSGYLASDYCKQEVRWFQAKAGKEPLGLAVGDRLRIFNVLLNNIPFAEWPAEFGRTSGFPFHDAESADDFGYPADPQEKPFQLQMRKLVEAVYRTLCAMKESLPSVAPVAAPSAAAPVATASAAPPAASDAFTVFLADTADSLRTLRKRVTAELQSKGINVIADVPPPYEAAAHEERAVAAINSAHLAVHLLDSFPGREIEDAEDKSYAQRQVELSIEHARSQFIWVPKALDLVSLEDGTYKEFLDRLENGERSDATYKFLRGLPAELPREILDEIECARRRPPADAAPLAALVDTHFKDQLYALDLIRYLSEKNVQPYINPEEDDPRKNIRILEERLKQVTKLIIVFGSVTSEWVRARLGAAVEIAITEGCPLKACGVFYAGARRKSVDSDFRLGLFPVYTFDTADLGNPQALKPLLEAV
ncbi:MAG TPA: toll/interleukin-1 receptor domain-containing protein [Blastocatellia bacterium]|nr:toll/interleukin-1 receptor domain-containing protein [Blastocatellia bacterium]